MSRTPRPSPGRVRLRHVLPALAALVGALLVAPAPALAANAEPALVPSPRSWTGGTGSTVLTTASRIVVDPASSGLVTTGADSELLVERTVAQVAARLGAEITEVTGLALPVVTSATAAAGDVRLALAADAGLGTEGYTLDADGTVTITAPTSTGVYYGGVSLLQMLRLDPAHAAVPNGEIRDVPALAYRAEHFDVSRRYMSVADLQDEIRRMAWHKLNVLQLMFNQANAFRLYSPAYAGLAPTDPGQRYGQADIAAIEAVAAEYHVTVVPEIQNPTKAQPIAVFNGVDRSLSAECGDASTLDFTDPAVGTWFNGLVGTFLPWFSGPYVHLGNDEVPAALATCDYLEAQYTTATPTIADLQEVWIEDLRQTVEAAGKRAMIWTLNTAIRPDTDVLIMNFGATSASAGMRALGYDVIDTAYKTGAYDRFYISPGDYEGKAVPRGDIYAWTPVTDVRNRGQVLAAWGDDLFFSETGYYLDLFDGRRSELAERTWNPDPATATFAQFTAAVTALGTAPGAAARNRPAPTTDAEPVHTYSFETPYVPTTATHFPGGWNLSLADGTGTLHGNGWLYRPVHPAAGYLGNGLGFTAGTTQTLNLGGRSVQAPWTVSAWIRRTADSTNTVLLRDLDYGIKIEEYGSDHKVGLTKYGTGNYPFDYTVPLNTWTHLTLVGTTSGTTLYANGTEVDSLPEVIHLPLGGIGGKRPFSGSVDELAVYRQALTPAQVAALYTGASGGPDLALNRPVTVSSTYRVGVEPGKAVDGDPATRWSSDRTDPQWITVDLGSSRTVSRVRLNWEAAYGKAYEIQVSDDNATWTTLYGTTTGDGAVDDLTGLSGSGRYVRVFGTQRGTVYGYSLWEVNVYGP
ncbi:hexosaminidase [Actinocorallia herbida]|uniref:beta-N-acetylhexosaminidase n=1 Tax=Actinocorallia herbida TaxID=58109 RepID=A0A3N1CUZ0_9ACTN|nr:family 20 glycosylhydrolase [Actinocorallia herbida]ROO85130.1 hexosaminidase [Actinocorallia herbida]